MPTKSRMARQSIISMRSCCCLRTGWTPLPPSGWRKSGTHIWSNFWLPLCENGTGWN